MNIHHLELFYYVAKHGGIMEAVRNIPYGIQQPAVSGQVAQLEEYLGATLFQRRPFELTPHGEKLYQHIAPFFSSLEKITTEIQGGQERHIRIGSSAVVLREHLPELFQSVRRKFPGLKIYLRQGLVAQLEEALQRDEIDLVITLIERKPAAGIHALALMELPLVLLVEKNSPIKSAEEFWRRDRITEPLICLPKEEPICKTFQKKLGELGVDWFPGVETSSADLVESYAAGGMGVGLSVAIPKKGLHPNLRALPLPGFPPVALGALWRGRKTPLIQMFLDEAQRRVKKLL
jgi:DNA-binding transcriptional LysR family regulator